jgi:HSP20 family protein
MVMPFRDFDRLVETFFGGPGRVPVMSVDAERDGDTLYLQFDLPGVDAESIDLTVEQNMLSVRARRTRAERDGVERLAAERPMGTFTRQLLLADALEADKLDATYDNGVLTVRIPVTEQARPKRIAVKRGVSAQRQLTT